jgi:hypothetical protein
VQFLLLTLYPFNPLKGGILNVKRCKKQIDINNIKEIILQRSKWMFLGGQKNELIIITYKNDRQVEQRISVEEIEYLFMYNHNQVMIIL